MCKEKLEKWSIWFRNLMPSCSIGFSQLFFVNTTIVFIMAIWISAEESITMATASKDRTLRLWKVNTWNCSISAYCLYSILGLVFFLCFFGCCRLILSAMPTFLGGLGHLRFCRGTMRQYKVLQHRLAGIWSLIFQYSYAVILVYYLYDQSLILVYSTLHPAYFSDLFWFLGFFY